MRRAMVTATPRDLACPNRFASHPLAAYYRSQIDLLDESSAEIPIDR
jgi:hypothetical protein